MQVDSQHIGGRAVGTNLLGAVRPGDALSIEVGGVHVFDVPAQDSATPYADYV
jgi:hypothetical protein